MSLEVGDKYLSVSLDVRSALYECHKAIHEGKDKINFFVFKNDNAGVNNAPEWKATYSAVWEKIKQQQKTEVEIVK